MKRDDPGIWCSMASVGETRALVAAEYDWPHRVDVDSVKDTLRNPGAMSELEVQWLLDEALAAIEQLEEDRYDDEYETDW